MTVSARRWSRRIKEDLFAIHGAEELVATSASDVAVLTLQSEFCALVVIERGWLPFRGVVAIAALGDLI